MSSEEQIRDIAQAASAAFAGPFDGVLKIILDEERALMIDGGATPPTISTCPADAEGADCTWRGAPDIIMGTITGRRPVEKAFVSGRLSISGDMSLMSRLELKSVR